jgi:hypothetical protein
MEDMAVPATATICTLSFWLEIIQNMINIVAITSSHQLCW